MWQALLHFLHCYPDPNLDCVLCWTLLLHWEGQSYSFPVVHPIEGFLGEIAWVTTHTQKSSGVPDLATSRFSDGLETPGEHGCTTERSVEELSICTREFRICLCTQSTIISEIIPDIQKVHSSAQVGLNQLWYTVLLTKVVCGWVYVCVRVRVGGVCLGVWMKGLRSIIEVLPKSKEMLIFPGKNL